VSARRDIVGATVLAIIGTAILIALGAWQLERKARKEGLIADLNARLSVAPQSLPSSPEQPRDEFRRVKLRAQFLPGEQALVYTAGSALRPDVSGAGYWVLALARVDSGGVVVINRGFAAAGTKGVTPPAPPGETEIIGVLRWPEQSGMFTPRDEPHHNLFYSRDPEAIARAKGWGAVAPYYIEQESPQLAGAPRAGPLVVKLPNNHLQYAITWFGLALALAGVYLIWLRGRLRRP
jgi:surfeit locus 1 family protein